MTFFFVSKKGVQMFQISKSFDFCYGHRVYSQNVNTKYAIEDDNPCRRIHGHQGNVTVEMESLEVDNRGFVIDFKELSFIKKFINDNLDHRFILSFDDPRFVSLTGGYDIGRVHQLVSPIILLDDEVMGYRCKEIEQDSFVFVDFNPTSENLAKWIFESVKRVLDNSPFECQLKQVVWSETPKTQAVYSNAGCY